MQIADAMPVGAIAAAEVRWSALDQPAEWDSFGRVLAGGQGAWESYIAIEGMYCPGCSLNVETALSACPGVTSVQVNGTTATARLVWQPGEGRPSAWLHALQRAGYGALPAGDLLAAAPRQRAQRMMLWRWLVAGFCMMQVMMYATPAYVADPGDITPDIQSLLRWASWVLTLPVVLFSCRPFFASALRDLRARRVGMDVPVALGIVIAFAGSSAATFDPAGVLGAEVWYDSVTMFAFFLLSGRLLEDRLRSRTAGALESLMRRLPDTVEREGADGEWTRVAVRRLAVGDAIRVLPGEVVPVDGTVVEGASRVDEALLTGESRPLLRQATDAVVAGSHNLSGVLRVRVDALGEDTRYAGIVALMARASVDKPRLAQLADRVATPFLWCVLLAAAGAAAWWWRTDPVHAIGVAVAVLIVTCPCALSLATPAATLAAAGQLARRGVLVRRLQALESGAAIDTVVFDKTGTLTEDRMRLVRSWCRPGWDEAGALALAGALARHSLHPLSRALAAAAPAHGGRAIEVTEVAGQGLVGQLQDGPGVAGQRLRLGSAVLCGEPPPCLGEPRGPRVHLADEAGWLASFELDEALRPDALATVQTLQRLGLDVQLLSGDRPAAVARLAAVLGLAGARGDCAPEDKLAYVAALQQAGRRVAMVGDGVNDTPVLARADLSVAMGRAVPVAHAQADFIVLGSQLGAVAELLRQARRTRRVVRQNLAWAAVYNAVCVPLAVVGAMPPWLAGFGMAASSLAVVLNAARLAKVPARN